MGGGSRVRTVAARILQWTSAGFLAAGLAASQIFLGGAWFLALAVPGYFLVGVAGVVAGLLFWRSSEAPGAWCSGVVLLFAAYLLWRQSASLDAFAAREDVVLLLGALAVYLTAAWQLRGDGPRWLVLGVIFLLVVVQTGLAVAQFTAEAAFHPLADLLPALDLPDGDQPGHGAGWITGTLASRGSLSAVLLASTFLALGMLVWGREGVAVKLLLLWVTAAGFVGLALCLSRAAYLGAIAGLITFALVSFFVLTRGALAHRLWLAAGALLLTAASLLLAFTVGLESVTVRLRVDALGLDAYRESLWFVTAAPMLGLEPWFGTGANSFDLLSLRYRGSTPATLPVHAHNDWLQLLIEYGRIGFALGVLFFIVHLLAGFRGVLRLTRDTPPVGLLPRSTELGLATGALAVLVAQGMHSFFDFRLHVPAVVFLVALAAGWLAAGGRTSMGAGFPWWLRPLGLLPAVAGAFLLWVVGREAAAEVKVLQATNAMYRGEMAEVWDLASDGLGHDPGHPRLHFLAGTAARAQARALAGAADEARWYAWSADHFGEAVRQRPLWPEALREYALALDWSHRALMARPYYLRAIARDPDWAVGYEYLALHLWRRGRLDEAERLLHAARRLPGSQRARQYLEDIAQQRQEEAARLEASPPQSERDNYFDRGSTTDRTW